jgi:predicted dienelactone hydrolase
MLRAVIAFVLFSITLGSGHAAPVDVVLGEWTDGARMNRVVPYKLYVPANAQGALPIVIFSHGLGGNRDGAEYLLRFLAEHGYVAVAVQHPGSDTPAVFGNADEGGTFSQSRLEQGVRDAVTPSAAADRFRDIPFAIDQLTAMNANDARLRGRLDLTRIGMSGHSYGALTTLALAGQGFGAGGDFSFADARIKAALAMSPNKPRQGDPRELFATIRIPTFHMTGTKDENPLDDNDPVENRQVPYRSIVNADKFLLVFTGGDHMIFSGRSFFGAPRPADARFHTWIQKASLAYWDAYLRDDKTAKAYLTGGKFPQDLGGLGTFEYQLR